MQFYCFGFMLKFGTSWLTKKYVSKEFETARSWAVGELWGSCVFLLVVCIQWWWYLWIDALQYQRSSVSTLKSTEPCGLTISKHTPTPGPTIDAFHLSHSANACIFSHELAIYSVKQPEQLTGCSRLLCSFLQPKTDRLSCFACTLNIFVDLLQPLSKENNGDCGVDTVGLSKWDLSDVFNPWPVI